MSRHRNVRSMNYSEEYEGFEDVYGHSVEDDNCISPSEAGFLFDRTRCHQMSAFINEENYIAEEEDQQNVQGEKKFQKSDLSEVDLAKLTSCVEGIQDVIGDIVPVIRIEEVAMNCNFDYNVALDQILNEAEMRHCSSGETGPARSKKPGNKDKDETAESSLGNRLMSSMASFSGGGDGPERSVEKFVIPKLKCVPVEGLEKGLNDLSISEGTSDDCFSSLRMLMDRHRKDTDREEPPIVWEKQSAAPIGNPSTLAELSDCFLGARNAADPMPESSTEFKSGFLIPKLRDRKSESPENWVIDLSSAIRAEPERPSEERSRRTRKDETGTPPPGPSSEEARPGSGADRKRSLDAEANLRAVTASPFGRILCRKWKGRPATVTGSRRKPPSPALVPFVFDSPSPDDLILKYLARK